MKTSVNNRLVSLKKIIFDKLACFEWMLARKLSCVNSQNNSGPILILPADPVTLNGSKGDEAMLVAVRDYVVERFNGVPIYVHISTEVAKQNAISLGFLPHKKWGRGVGIIKSIISIRSLQPRAIIVIGADMMDGYYSLPHSMRILAIAENFSKSNKKIVFCGFSFNENPRREIVRAFQDTGKRLMFNVRDELSKSRLDKVVGEKKTVLTADCAFLLKPTFGHRYSNLYSWLETRRKTGRLIVGFNIHGMLDAKTEDISDGLLEASHKVIDYLLSSNFSVVLISHDNRGAVGDDVILEGVYKHFKTRGADNIFYSDSRIPVSEIKALASLMDIVITGRMHLAIAALGSGVPTLALTYQGKFAGMMRHFLLPDTLLASPEVFNSSKLFLSKTIEFIDNRDVYHSLVLKSLDNVRSLAEKNFKDLEDCS